MFQEWPHLSVPAVVRLYGGVGGRECGLCVNAVMKFREWLLGLSLRHAPCQQRSEGCMVRPLWFL